MKKFLKETMYLLMLLIGIAISISMIAKDNGNVVVQNFSTVFFIIVLLLCGTWSVLVIVFDFKERIKYEKKTVWPMIGWYIFIIAYSIYISDGIMDGLGKACILIVFISIYNFIIAVNRRDRVKIDSNYNLRDCKREDADFIYELKKEGFEWYIKDLQGWDEDEQREIIKNEMDAHLKDMNRGIGYNLLKYLIVNNPNKRLYLRTYKENPARELYIKHGFSKFDETETHWWMERK